MSMKIAIPVADGQLCMHFGHCTQFAILEADLSAKRILSRTDKTPPPHTPGVLPDWLSKEDVKLVIAGGMGRRAQQLFQELGVDVLVGAPAQSPEALVEAYLNGSLSSGENICDH